MSKMLRAINPRKYSTSVAYRVFFVHLVPFGNRHICINGVNWRIIVKNHFLYVIIYIIAIASASLIFFSSGVIKRAAALVYILICLLIFFKDESSPFLFRVFCIVSSLTTLINLIADIF